MNTQKAETLANRLIKSHSLKGWKFEFDNALSRFGYCNYRTKTISLSQDLTKLNTTSETTDVILHEIAHALIGIGHGHNKTWKTKAVSIGCEPTRCYNNDVITPNHKWQATCPNCNHIVLKHRRTKSLSCGKCCKKYNNNNQ